jgi:hypothetical protein
MFNRQTVTLSTRIPDIILPLVIEERLKRREGFSMAKARSQESLDSDAERTPQPVATANVTL